MFLILGSFLIHLAFIRSDDDIVYNITHIAWFEVESKNFNGTERDYQGNFSIGLFGNITPMTVKNFIGLTKGYKSLSKELHYLGTSIHRIVKDFVIQMGDVTKSDGSGGASIYGKKFDDENFILSHRSPGWVSMANSGFDTNSSQFFILLTKARWLDRKHVVFGKVIKGFKTIQDIGEMPLFKDTSTPIKPIKIIGCGVQTLDEPYTLESDDLDETRDINI